MCFRYDVLQIRRVDHDELSPAAFGGEPLRHQREQTQIAPPLPELMEGFGWPYSTGRIATSEPVATDEIMPLSTR